MCLFRAEAAMGMGCVCAGMFSCVLRRFCSAPKSTRVCRRKESWQQQMTAQRVSQETLLVMSHWPVSASFLAGSRFFWPHQLGCNEMSRFSQVTIIFTEHNPVTSVGPGLTAGAACVSISSGVARTKGRECVASEDEAGSRLWTPSTNQHTHSKHWFIITSWALLCFQEDSYCWRVSRRTEHEEQQCVIKRSPRR